MKQVLYLVRHLNGSCRDGRVSYCGVDMCADCTICGGEASEMSARIIQSYGRTFHNPVPKNVCELMARSWDIRTVPVFKMACMYIHVLKLQIKECFRNGNL